MTVRERLEAMDELDRLSERMQTMPKKYPAASGSPERFEVRELQAEHRVRSEEHTSQLQSLMRRSYAVFCLKKKKPHRAHPGCDARTRRPVPPPRPTHGTSR